MLGFSANKQLLPTQEVQVTSSTQVRVPVMKQSIEEEMSYLDVVGSTKKGAVIALLEWGQYNRIAKKWRVPLNQVRAAPDIKEVGSIAVYQMAFLVWRKLQISSPVDVLFRYSDSPLNSALIQTAHLFDIKVYAVSGDWNKTDSEYLEEVIEEDEIDQYDFKHIFDFSDEKNGTITDICLTPSRSIWRLYHKTPKAVTVNWNPKDLDLILYLLQQEAIRPITSDHNQWKTVLPEQKKPTKTVVKEKKMPEKNAKKSTVKKSQPAKKEKSPKVVKAQSTSKKTAKKSAEKKKAKKTASKKTSQKPKK